MTNSILLQNVSPDQFTELLTTVFKTQLNELKKELQHQSTSDDLLSREQVLELLQINASTLWHWQNAGKITAYKFANKSYFKKAEVLAGLTPLKKAGL